MLEPLRPLRVAVLDSSPLARHALSSMLKEAGLQLTSEWSAVAQAAIELSRDSPTVALVGFSKDVESELAFIESAHRQAPDVRFLALADEGDSSDLISRAWRAGAQGYLEKAALSGNALASAVRAVAEGIRVLPGNCALGRLGRPKLLPTNTLAKLSERENEVLRLVSSGSDNLKIAALLGIAERTVKAHVSALYRKLGIENRSQLVILARESGLHLQDDEPH